MSVSEGAYVALGDCTKGADYVPAAVTLYLNGVIYPNFATFMIEGKIRKNDQNGAEVTASAAAFQIASGPLAQVVLAAMTDTTTAALDCERLYWSCKGTDASSVVHPLCYGYIRVKPEATY